MGQAKAKKAQREQAQVVQDRIATAMQKVIGALSSDFGMDCVFYARVGELVLQALGYKEAKAVAGEAVWRVGPGTGDVISNAASVMQPGMSLYGSGTQDKPAGAFHAYIECGDELVDFTLYTLRAKAAALDAADGGKTQVDWAPSYLWVKKSRCIPLEDVSKSWVSGKYGYKRMPDVENVWLDWDGDDSADADESPHSYAVEVLRVYKVLEAGGDVRVMGISPDGTVGGVQDRVNEYLDRGLKALGD